MNRTAIPAFIAMLVLATVPGGADPGKAPLGASYPCGRGGLADAPQRLDRMRAAGFAAVSFVPNYPYTGRNRIDFAAAPGFDELGAAVETALRRGMTVVLKPHLEPAMYTPGFDSLKSEEHGWRIRTSWRGFFDVDPMSPAYREGMILPTLAMIRRTLARLDTDPAFSGKAEPIRFELGTELMDSVVYQPERWEALLKAARQETRRLGLEGRVLLSHNFSHHFELPEDFVDRMSPSGRRALARYIKGLDAFAVSQYMDLTAAMPAGDRGKRLPTVPEVAAALRLHERNLRRDILQGLLGLKPAEIPAFHIGEFGVGRGGLRHPNLWEGTATGAEAEALAHEIALGHRGLLEYLRRDEGRTARSATLWLTGRYYDIFGWMNPADAVPEAALAVTEGLAGAAMPRAPADFDGFWAGTLQELAAVPMDLRLTESPEQSDEKVTCSKADYRSLRSIPVHAWYCRPRGTGPYPAILLNPWYGQTSIPAPRSVAERGFAVLSYQGRGFAVDLSSYPVENAWYILSGIEDRDTYVYREMFSHAVRGIDVLASRPEVDPRRIGAGGSSQGGGLSLVVAALDPRVAAVSADFPFLCDFASSLRQSLSPFQDIREFLGRSPDKQASVSAVLPYFDALNFAPRIRAPVKVQVGLRDRTCPPEGIRNVYSRIRSEKTLEEFQADHNEENASRWEKMLSFLFARLGGTP